MAKRNTLRLDFSGFNDLVTRLDKLGGDIQEVVEDALMQAGETIADDTIEAMGKINLPAQGKYSKGDTIKSIIKNPRVVWSGPIASINVGFDYDKPGAGGFLITGTPRMKPNAALQKIYKRKKYMDWISQGMQEIVTDAINEKLGG